MAKTEIDKEELTSKELAAQILAKYKNFEDTDKPEIMSQLKAINAELDKSKDIDVKKVWENVESMKASYDKLVKDISKNNKNGVWIPGLEDEAKKFSFVRAAFAVKTGNWTGAGFEEEVIKAARPQVKTVVGVDSEAGFFVPDQVIADVIGAIYARSVLINFQGATANSVARTRISVLDGLIGSPVRIPKFNGGMIAFWIGERDEYIESAAKVGNVTLSPKKLTALTRLTQEARMMTGYGYENLLRTDMARALALKLDRTGFYGTGGDNQPRGIFSMDGIPQFSAETNDVVAAGTVPGTAAGGELGYDGLMNMAGQVEDANLSLDDSSAIIAAPRWFRRLKQVKVQYYSGQTTQQAYLLGAPVVSDAKLKELVGDFDKSTQMANAILPGATAGWGSSASALYGDVVMGNWSEMLMGRWGALELVDDEGRGPGFLRDEIYIKIRAFFDFGVRHKEAFSWCPDAKMR